MDCQLNPIWIFGVVWLRRFRPEYPIRNSMRCYGARIGPGLDWRHVQDSSKCWPLPLYLLCGLFNLYSNAVVARGCMWTHFHFWSLSVRTVYGFHLVILTSRHAGKVLWAHAVGTFSVDRPLAGEPWRFL
jgi:hypothetical protein